MIAIEGESLLFVCVTFNVETKPVWALKFIVRGLTSWLGMCQLLANLLTCSWSHWLRTHETLG